MLRTHRLASIILNSGKARVLVSQNFRSSSLANPGPNIVYKSPDNYYIPERPATMDDTMEPYGSWKVAYEAQRKRANKTLFKGIVCFATTCTLFYYSGVLDGLFMPNLDNIMEDTEPIDLGDREGRISV